MFDRQTDASGRFCWLDLAANNADAAKLFYRHMFGWKSDEQAANGGRFTRLRLCGRDVGSIYQLKDAHLARGVPSHWTPYVHVQDVSEAAQRAVSYGGAVIVRPFAMSDFARIALVTDSVGAIVGLWEPVALKDGGDGGG